MKSADLKSTMSGLPRLLYIAAIYFITLRWLRELLSLYRENLEDRRRGKNLRHVRRGRPTHCSPRCAVIRPDVYKRADPLIYSQRYLMEQGLAVTWNNPDIQLFRNGTPVSSSSLEPDTDYQVVATIHNNSTEAPAVGLKVAFSFQSFGVSTALVAIGSTFVNLPVKGAPGHPTSATMPWRTPAAPGHYCLIVELIWADDANPKNNVGQENTNVIQASSPAVIRIPIRNNDTILKTIRMTADAYTIPELVDCEKKPRKEDSDRRHPTLRRVDVFVPVSEREADWTFARSRHGIDRFPVPQNWTVALEPAQFDLDAGQTQEVMVTVTPPEDFRGERSFNLNAMHGARLLGGVTLAVRR